MGATKLGGFAKLSEVSDVKGSMGHVYKRTIHNSKL